MLEIGTVIEYTDMTRRGITHFGRIREITIRRDGVSYVTQDHHIVSEKNILNIFAVIPPKGENNGKSKLSRVE